jgi:hypothetical protein
MKEFEPPRREDAKVGNAIFQWIHLLFLSWRLGALAVQLNLNLNFSHPKNPAHKKAARRRVGAERLWRRRKRGLLRSARIYCPELFANI